jgi:uncharacterized protein YcbK (DUF882 family)
MIVIKELLSGNKLEDQSPEIQANLLKLLDKVNIIRKAWGKPMMVTSGLRTLAHHLAIYAAKGITDQAKIPMKSKHLLGAACDISDPKLEITHWLEQHTEILEQADLYYELGNSNWLHLQIIPFGSYKPGGTRGFNP